MEDGRHAVDEFVEQAKANPQSINEIEARVFGPFKQRASKLGLNEG